jgi:mRNA-degrading endonuclease YafQ of YafQ-DinJ toxin-antitoxin module
MSSLSENAQPRRVVILQSPLFKQTATAHFRDKRVEEAFTRFIQTKVANPIAPYGSSDKSFAADGNFGRLVPKIRHAHLTHDISVSYTISGANPVELRLYSIATHDELGTGQPGNPKKQKSVAKQFANQSFEQPATVREMSDEALYEAIDSMNRSDEPSEILTECVRKFDKFSPEPMTLNELTTFVNRLV